MSSPLISLGKPYQFLVVTASFSKFWGEKKVYIYTQTLMYIYTWDSLVAQMVKNLPAMQESQIWPLGQEDPLEKGKATPSRILAWRIPWREDPGGLQSKGSQWVRHDWTTNTHTHIYMQFFYIYPFSVLGFSWGQTSNLDGSSTTYIFFLFNFE